MSATISPVACMSPTPQVSELSLSCGDRAGGWTASEPESSAMASFTGMHLPLPGDRPALLSPAGPSPVSPQTLFPEWCADQGGWSRPLVSSAPKSCLFHTQPLISGVEHVPADTSPSQEQRYPQPQPHSPAHCQLCEASRQVALLKCVPEHAHPSKPSLAPLPDQDPGWSFQP